MGARHPNSRRVKIHRSYSVEEVCALLDVHFNTVRNWRRQGLEPIDDRRPILFQGSVLRAFLDDRRAKSKRPCGTGQIYCLPCRAPKEPAGGMADYQQQTPTRGQLIGICPDCDRFMYRTVAHSRLAEVAGHLAIQIS